MFGNPGAGLGGDNNLNNTYISDEPTFVKKSEKPKWMLGAVIIVAIAAIAIIGVFAVKMLGGSKVADGRVTIDVDGSDIYVSRGGTELLFKYDKKTDTVSYEKYGTKLIFERIQ